ncbi:748_t:CDS:1, partial [Diversispora eburnea]
NCYSTRSFDNRDQNFKYAKSRYPFVFAVSIVTLIRNKIFPLSYNSRSKSTSALHVSSIYLLKFEIVFIDNE